MKKLILFLLVISYKFSFSQAGAKWATGLNGIGSGDSFGTSNNYPILFKTNNSLRMTLGVNGVLNINNLSGTGSRILLADANGNISALSQGGSGQFLLSDGTWGDLPVGATSFNSSGSNIFTSNSGNFGIGTSSPAYKLDVLGDARISSNLYVGGGIVVTDKLDASIEVKAGNVLVNNDLNVTGNSNFSNNLKVSQLAGIGDRVVYVDASGRLVGGRPAPASSWECITGTPSWQIGGNNWSGLGMSYPGLTDANIGTCDNYDFILKSDNINRIWIKNNGNIGIDVSNPLTKLTVDSKLGHGIKNITDNPMSKSFVGFETSENLESFVVYGDGDAFFRGYVQIGQVITPGKGVQNSPLSQDGSRLKIEGAEFGDGIVVELPNSTNEAALKVIGGIATEPGASVNARIDRDGTGKFYQVHAGGNRTPGGNITSMNGAAMNSYETNGAGGLIVETKLTLANKYNTLLKVNRDDTKALSVQNSAPTTNEVFLVMGDGRTSIGTDYVPLGYKLAVNGKIVCEELNVILKGNWPDYVFSEKHTLSDLNSVEKFINKEKHLPGFETAKYYEENGVPLKEVVVKQQESIEKMMLYIIELKKEVDALKSK